MIRLGPLAFWHERSVLGMPGWKGLHLYVVLAIWKYSLSIDYHLGRIRE